MNRQFWGFTTGSLVPFFNDTCRRADASTCATRSTCRSECWRATASCRQHSLDRRLASADYVIVHHEHHMAEVDDQIWTLFGTTRPVYVLSYDGVPIISVYEHPRHAQRALAASADPRIGSRLYLLDHGNSSCVVAGAWP